MEIDGEFSSKMPLSVVHDLIGDLNEVSKCLPGIEEITEQEGRLRCSVRLDISEFKTGYLSTLSGKLYVSKTEGQNRISIHTEGRIAGSKIEIDVVLNLRDLGEITNVAWHSDIRIGILAKMLGEEAVNSFIRKTVDQVIGCLRGKI
ncbi:MAG: SRPBCC domain-containing protein [Thermoplasmataceae archaeon]